MPVWVVGLTLGTLLVRALRGVRSGVVHLVSFLALGGLVGWGAAVLVELTVLAQLEELGEFENFVLGVTVIFALAAGTGWLSQRRRLMALHEPASA